MPPLPAQSAKKFQALRLGLDGPDVSARADGHLLPVEAPLTVDVHGLGSFTLMASPHEALALAVGFVFSEGLINTTDDLSLAQVCADDPGVVRLRLARPEAVQGAPRNLVITSSCGLCGSANLGDLLARLPAAGEVFQTGTEALKAALAGLKAGQVLFRATGGTHAAGLFDAQGQILALAEDIGRHNALDRAIGKCLLAGRPVAGLAAILSGRVSLEMVGKAARAGLELVAAVSAPTSLALEAAERLNLTVVGFFREDRATVYTHPGRISDLPEASPGA